MRLLCLAARIQVCTFPDLTDINFILKQRCETWSMYPPQKSRKEERRGKGCKTKLPFLLDPKPELLQVHTGAKCTHSLRGKTEKYVKR